MKSFALFLVFAQAAIFQSYAQCLRPAPFLPGLVPSPCGAPILPQVVAQPQVLAPQVLAPQVISPSALSSPFVVGNSVANNLADTLSLLTVSSLLAESLPLGYPNVVSVPVAPSYGCGCGLGGYPYYL